MDLPEDMQRTRGDRVCKPESLTGCEPGRPGAEPFALREERRPPSALDARRGRTRRKPGQGCPLRPLPSWPVRSQSSRPRAAPTSGQRPQRASPPGRRETFPASSAFPGPRSPSPTREAQAGPAPSHAGTQPCPVRPGPRFSTCPPPAAASGYCGVLAISCRGRGAQPTQTHVH